MVAALLVGVLGALEPARADGTAPGFEVRGPPVIRYVRDGAWRRTREAFPGGALIVDGYGLHACPPTPKETPAAFRCAHPELRVRVGGRAALIVEALKDRVVLIVPGDLAAGPTVLEVTVAGRGFARVELDVVAPERWDELLRQLTPPDGNEQRAYDELRERQMLERFQLLGFEQVAGEEGARFEVEARVPVPDGLTVTLELQYGEHRLATHRAVVGDERVQCTFGPFSRALPPGRYSVALVFEIRDQPRDLVRPWLAGLERDERELFRRVVRRELVDVHRGRGEAAAEPLRDRGAPRPSGPEARQADRPRLSTPEPLSVALERRRREALQAHYLLLAEAARTLLGELREVYALAARSFFRGPDRADYDEERYRAYLAELGVAGADLERVVVDTRYASAAGELDALAFEQWVETVFLPAFAALEANQESFVARYIVSVDEEAEQFADALLATLERLLACGAAALYAKAELPLPAVIAEDWPEGDFVGPDPSIPLFKAQRRDLLRRVGLRHAVREELHRGGLR